MTDRPSAPRLVVDNEPLLAELFERAQQKLAALKPNYTYDDLCDEVERMRREEAPECR